MKRLILCAALLLGCSVSVLAQYPNNYETLCPQGSTPISGPSGTTYDQATSKYRAVTCVDPFGNISLSVSGSNFAIKGVSADAVRYVSPSGNDSNDGLSPGAAKATISGAYSTLPNCTVTPGFYNGSTIPSITAPCGTIQIAENTAGYTLSSTLISNGMLVRFVGMGMSPVILNCTTSPCITFNNQGTFGNPGLAAFYPSDGGLYNLSLVGNGSANQVGVNGLTASWLALKNVNFYNFNGTSASAITLTNDTVSAGYTEELDFNNVVIGNSTCGITLTTTGVSPNPSFGHNAWRHMQWVLANGQVGVCLSGAAGFYSSWVDGVFNTSSLSGSVNEFSIAGTATVRGMFSVPQDNGGGAIINICTVGCTSSNFQVVGFGTAAGNPGSLIARDAGITITQTPPIQPSTGLLYSNGAAIQWQLGPDGGNNLKFLGPNGNPFFGIFPTQGQGIFLTGATSGQSTIIAPATGGNNVNLPSAASVTPTFLDCGTTSTCAQTNQTRMISLKGGPIALAAGTLTVTSLPFTSATTYVCSADDSTGINGIDVIYNSGSSVTFNGTGTDNIRYECHGN